MSGRASRTALVEILAEEIRERGPLPFARFMERVLYEPGLGYYATSGGRAGRDGDYFTAAQVGSAFAECLARQLAEMDALLSRPDPFTVVELGAGNGLLCRALLDSMEPGLRERTRVLLVDASAAMREEARRRVPEATVLAPGDEGSGHVGAIVALELFDALPVHRVRRSGTLLREIYVDLAPDGGLVEREGEPLAATCALATRYGAAAQESHEAEVCPAALAEVDRMAGCLERGFLVVVDYGDSAAGLYGGRRPRGTLLAYHRHRTSESYLERVGEQDLTAHVNFTALEDRARERGLTVLGRTTQDRFLIANGILERFEEPDPVAWGNPGRVRARLEAKQLLSAGGMGRIFQVLVLAKGFAEGTEVRGLRDPFRESAP